MALDDTFSPGQSRVIEHDSWFANFPSDPGARRFDVRSLRQIALVEK